MDYGWQQPGKSSINLPLREDLRGIILIMARFLLLPIFYALLCSQLTGMDSVTSRLEYGHTPGVWVAQ